MALIIPPGYAQVALPLQHELLARTAFITYGADVSEYGGDYVEAANNAVDAFVGAWGENLDSQVVVGPAVLRVGQDGGDPLTVVGTDTGAGEESSAMPPPNVSLLVRKQTNLGGRRGRGRVYIPWVTQEAGINDVGNLDGGTLAARQANAASWMAGLTTAGPMYVLHDSDGEGVEPEPTEVVGLTVMQLIANQRRRLGR